ncbi:MAG: DUF6481 family protein [Pseudomonadota bacterium]|nr:DUF6481 family protein [Pseudomonadota bacterium]
MAGYKEPGFQERVAIAAQARETALAKLKAKPQIDEAEIARLKAEHDAREAAKLEKSAAIKAAREADREAEREARRLREEAAALAAAPAPKMSAEERKAIRDAKYAARKARKGR